MRRSVLAITDLTERSDAAVVWADTIARVRRWDLQLGHAIALAERERHTEERNLLQLERAIVLADAASRAQVERTLGQRGRLPSRVIDLDGLVPAMLRRTAQLQPELVVIAPGWSWAANDLDPNALCGAAIEQLGTSLLIVRHAAPPAGPRRIVVALDPARLDASLIQDAARWSYWLREAMQVAGRDRLPELDVIFIGAEEEGEADLSAAIDRISADLIVVPADIVVGTQNGAADRLMASLLEAPAAPVLVLSRSHAPPWSLEPAGDSHQRGDRFKEVSLIA